MSICLSISTKRYHVNHRVGAYTVKCSETNGFVERHAPGAVATAQKKATLQWLLEKTMNDHEMKVPNLSQLTRQ